MKKIILRTGSFVFTVAVFFGCISLHDHVFAAKNVPRVQLNTDNLGPREIEDLTNKSVPRDYALAWQTMEQALDQNRPALLENYFTGQAKQDLGQRVKSQIKSGIHTKYQDGGHKLEGIFYSPAGDVMELRDHARLEMQILDGSKVIFDGPVNREFIVLMTPGSDRWLVRDLQSVPGEKP